ncbi:MAG: quinone-dependent dihydroorotate dehydrogenase [Candidatus Zambryskibacteria bacterium CG10_big_fil_rev_8_21_14_0_10_34_34]|uniref:Dihydroorotate oxidase n=1 Tax=Candidatus Zambryskibacteria bacterium CG10_big_fil_rev_8_21_14_0_10_34_34 TaxID=1975114 RepID=A0A2H0R1H9_9BACT|nr:MAG: quinone-dependent dihydroorotate dehydrogenase [Candidatus Zambryskibacteria bacterium CG10_big_fil_rev_8_21_14_0_10_34_34]
MLYKKVLKPILFRFDPEKVHNFFVFIGTFAGKSVFFKKIVRFFYGYKEADVSKTVDGLTYQTPFILSAGFDYNAKLPAILSDISFGGVEVGSVTARFCMGNKKPRLKRLIKSKSILVNKGLANEGVETIIERLKKYKKQNAFVVGVSIARTNDKKTCSTEEGLADYFYSFKRLNEENVGDYYTLNISCPNAFGGESFTVPDLLEILLTKISSIPCSKPIYVKMPINLEWLEFDKLLKIIERFEGIKGVIIGNLNKDYNSLVYRDEAPENYQGGLSGKPCFETSNKLIKQTREIYGKRFTIIGCGGVMSKEDMVAKFEAGSDLVALITGMIYNGPGFLKELSDCYYKNIKI